MSQTDSISTFDLSLAHGMASYDLCNSPGLH